MTTTRAPDSRAVSAAHSAALPPPTTMTSYSGPAIIDAFHQPRHHQRGAGDEQAGETDRPCHEDREVAFADRDGAPELQLRKRAEHEAKHRRHERDVVDAHQPPDRTDDVEEREVEHRSIE